MNQKDFDLWLMKHEGFRSKPYKDTVGVLTIGYGTNLDQGISKDQAKALMDIEVAECRKQLRQYTWYTMQPEGVQFALLNMCYNLGITRLLKFKRTIGFLENREYKNAAWSALQSKWARQVGQRAKDVALMISEGK